MHLQLHLFLHSEQHPVIIFFILFHVFFIFFSLTTESLTKFDPADIRMSEGETTVNSSETEPVSILRRRKVAEGESCYAR